MRVRVRVRRCTDEVKGAEAEHIQQVALKRLVGLGRVDERLEQRRRQCVHIDLRRAAAVPAQVERALLPQPRGGAQLNVRLVVAATAAAVATRPALAAGSLGRIATDGVVSCRARLGRRLRRLGRLGSRDKLVDHM